jgi:hypothetical protein
MAELPWYALTPFLPAEARYRFRQRDIDMETALAARRIFGFYDVSVTVVRSSRGGRSGQEMTVAPVGPRRLRPGWFDHGRLQWDGASLTAVGENGASASWRPKRGGLEPGFGAETVSRTKRRPTASGECPDTVAEIAAVALKSGPPRRIYFLDQESHHLAVLPMLGLAEADVAALAARAGVDFRVYSLVTGDPLVPLDSVPPDALCEVLFPRSARRRKLLVRGIEEPGWWAPR